MLRNLRNVHNCVVFLRIVCVFTISKLRADKNIRHISPLLLLHRRKNTISMKNLINNKQFIYGNKFLNVCVIIVLCELCIDSA